MVGYRKEEAEKGGFMVEVGFKSPQRICSSEQ